MASFALPIRLSSFHSRTFAHLDHVALGRIGGLWPVLPYSRFVVDEPKTEHRESESNPFRIGLGLVDSGFRVPLADTRLA